MDEAKFFEILGRKQTLLENQDAAYTSLLGILALVIRGEIDPNRIQIDQVARTWKLSEPLAEQKPEETNVS